MHTFACTHTPYTAQTHADTSESAHPSFPICGLLSSIVYTILRNKAREEQVWRTDPLYQKLFQVVLFGLLLVVPRDAECVGAGVGHCQAARSTSPASASPAPASSRVGAVAMTRTAGPTTVHILSGLPLLARAAATLNQVAAAQPQSATSNSRILQIAGCGFGQS